MNQAWSLGFTLSSLAVMAPGTALADDADPAEQQAQPPEPGPPVVARARAAPEPPEASEPSEPSDLDPTPRERRKEHMFVGVDGGYSVQNLYGIPITGMGFTAMLANDVGPFTVGAELDFVRGWTQEGLQTTAVNVGPVLQLRFDRLLAGGGFRVGTFDVSRVTTTSPLLSTSCGVFLRLSYDVATFGTNERSAIFVLGKASIDSVDAPLYAAGLGVGVRL